MASATKIGLFFATVLIAPTQLMAQTLAPPVSNTASPTSSATASPAPSLSNSTQPADATKPVSQLGEVIVTAQRRSENLQKVPVSVSVVSGVQLAQAGVENLQDLRVLVPGLLFSSIQQNVQPRLRGIGSSTAGPGIEPGVAVYVDGVYYASATSALFSFNDVSQISVLKGPQGTLFGRNSDAGLVQITTRDPTQAPDVEGSVGYGNYDTLKTSLYVAGGIADNLAADLAAMYTTQGIGYGRNLTTGQYTAQTAFDLDLRSKFVFTPSNSTKITLSMDYADVKGTQGTDRLEMGSTPAPGTGPNYGGSPWDVEADYPGFNDNMNGGVSLKIEQKLDGLNFLSITAYRRLDYENALDVDFTASPYQTIRQSQHDAQISQEFQLQSASSGPFKWTTGVYFFSADDVTDPEILNQYGLAASGSGVTNIFTVGGEKTQSIAGYAQGSYAFSTGTTLTAGARYTEESRIADTAQTLTFLGGSTLPLSSEEKHDFHSPTFRLAVDQKISDGLMAYVSYNTGFKSGGYNAQQIDAPLFKPETLTAYETGVKSTLFDRRVTLDGALFYYDYHNVQLDLINPNQSLGVENGPPAHAYGIDVDAAAKVTNAFQLTANIEGLKTKFISGTPLVDVGTSPNGGVPPHFGSVDDNQLPLAPNFTGTVGGVYTLDLGDGGAVAASGDVSYNSGWYTEPDNVVRQPSFVQVNSRLTWTASNRRLNASIWGSNLTNAAVRTNAGTDPNGNQYVSFAPPRTFGVTVGFKY